MAPQPGLNPDELIAAQALLSGLTGFSARAAHDLLGPLRQSTSLLTLFIQRYRSSLDPEADHLLELLATASARMETVADGVRKYLEIAGKELSCGPVDLNASLASSIAALENAIASNTAVVVSDSLPMVSADAAQMATVFEILIGNSIKFRKPDASPRIQVSSREAGDVRRITITDNGIGIDPKHFENVFLPFKRLNGAEYPGTGLGLATAKLIIEMHGGSIRIIDSPPGSEQVSGGTHVELTMRAIESK
jgi:light-regulated signal transduction histidine kinase (bacteriophytochrome)